MMRKIVLSLVIASGLVSAAHARSLGFSQSTSLSTASAAALPSIPATSKSFIMSVEGASIRWRDDGTDPTTSVGHHVAPGAALCYSIEPSDVKVIGVTSGATINVSYYSNKGCAQ